MWPLYYTGELEHDYHYYDEASTSKLPDLASLEISQSSSNRKLGYDRDQTEVEKGWDRNRQG
jgi:hypothetical protein